MPVDARIAMGYRAPEIQSPMNALAGVLQMQGAQQKQQLGALEIEKYRRDSETENKLAELYRTSVKPDGSIDRERLFSGAAQGGLGAKIPGLKKGFADSDKATGEVDAQKFKLATDRHAIFQKTMGALKDDPNLSKQLITQVGQSLVQQGILPPELYDKAIASMPDDPAQLRQRLAQGLATQMTPEAIFTVFAPKAEKMDNGQQIGFRDTNPNSPTYGQNTAGAAVQKLQTPDSVASGQISTQNSIRSTNASLANASATREIAKATRDAAGMARDRDTEMKIGDDYRKQSKSFQDVGEAYRLINSTLDKATTSPAATLASATKFMKLLDPGSVVRESELGMALAATGVIDRAANYVETLKRGKVLTSNQVADFKKITAQIYGAAQAGQKKIDADYTGKAKTYNLRPEMIVQDLGQNDAPAAPAGMPSGFKVIRD